MSIELTHPNGQTFELSETGWKTVRALGRAYGWEGPMDLSLGLSREEAEGLAEAVEKGLDDLTRRPRPPKRTEEEAEEMSLEEALPYLFNKRTEGLWRKFVAFCRGGGFRVQEV